jgi:hypothetical protein
MNATMDGVVLRPSLLAITTGSLPSKTATQLLVVPKSIPIILLILVFDFAFNVSIDMPTRKRVNLYDEMAECEK